MSTKVKVLLIALVLVLLGLGIWKSNTSTSNSNGAVDSSVAEASGPASTVKVLTGSAKFNYLKDPELTKLLAAQGMTLELVKSGAYATDVAKERELDGAWPAGANAAVDFANSWKGSSTYPVMSTPLAIASWKQLLPILQANGLAKQNGNHADFYLEKALPLMLAGKRWNQLKDNSAFNVNKGLLVSTPDVRKSNTGALYIAALAYIQNGSEVPQDLVTGQALAEKLAGLITRQGFQEGTLSGPFEDYVGQGIGKAPLVLVYESQYVEAHRDNKLRDSHMLFYPQPGMSLKHVFVGRTAAGKKLGEFLATNPEAQKIAARYGFRTNSPAVFAEAMKQIGLDTPELLDLADAPSTAVMDAMQQILIKKLEGN